MNKKNNIKKDIISLIISQGIVKIFGVLYKLYLANKIGFGDEGNAIYNAGYQIYALLLTISSIGVPSAMAKIVAEENARYQLRQKLVLKSSVNLTVPFSPIFGVNNLVLISDDFFQLVKQPFLIQSVNYSLNYGRTMSITVSNINNLPFITNQRQ